MIDLKQYINIYAHNAIKDDVIKNEKTCQANELKTNNEMYESDVNKLCKMVFKT